MPTGPASRLMPTLRRVVLAGSASDRTDGQLLGAFVAERDGDAFAGLVRRHGPMVLGVCRRVTGDLTTADDAFQAVFLVLARRAGAVKPREQVGNWLYGVAYRTAIKARAVQARRRSREKQVDVMPEPAVSSLPDAWSDLQPVIDEELARLPDKLRLPVVLCDLEGRSQREVARHLGVPAATLATRLATARRTLAQRLTRRGVTLSGGALAGLLTVHGTAAAVPHALAYGVARAAEAVAGGSVVTSLVSAHAIQLSEGVMRMMMLTKLKAVAVTALTLVALTGGLGLGLVPAASGSDPGPAAIAKLGVAPPVPSGNPATESVGKPEVEIVGVVFQERAFDVETVAVDDRTFLRRLILDVRGTVPTDLETWFFVDDKDAAKRAKLVTWMMENEDARTYVAKKFGVPPERVRLFRVPGGKDGKSARLVILIEPVADPKPKPVAVAFSPDGKRLAVELVDDLATTLNLTTAGDNVRVWDAKTGKALDVHKRRHRLALTGVNDSHWLDVQDDLLNATDPAAALFLFADKAHDEGPGVVLLDFLHDGKPDVLLNQVIWDLDASGSMDSDGAFLKRVVLDVRGNAPTALEEKYFAEDRDPKKREKLLDTLLKDPAVARKLGEQWKKKMLTAPGLTTVKPSTLRWHLDTNPPAKGGVWEVFPANPNAVPFELKFEKFRLHNPAQPSPKAVTPPATPKQPAPPAVPQADRLEKLVGELLAAKKTDAEMLEAVTLATVGRLPTDAEKRLTLGLVVRTADRNGAWVEIARALTATEEGAKRDGVRLRQMTLDVPFEIEVAPVPPAKR